MNIAGLLIFHTKYYGGKMKQKEWLSNYLFNQENEFPDTKIYFALVEGIEMKNSIVLKCFND